MPKPFQECPSFDACSCNVCPLDPDAGRLVALPGEERCHAKRTTREVIAARHLGLLPGRGLLPREIRRDARKAVWNSLPEDHPRKLALAKAQAMLPAKTLKK